MYKIFFHEQFISSSHGYLRNRLAQLSERSITIILLDMKLNCYYDESSYHLLISYKENLWLFFRYLVNEARFLGCYTQALF